MSGKIILNLAISLDGYIASEDGGFDWIVGDGDTTLNTNEGFDFAKFVEGVDIVVMGRACYDQGFAADYKAKEVFVATSEQRQDEDNIHFMSGDIVSRIQEETAKGKNVFLFGGGSVIDPFLKSDVIDEYIVGIIPTILGKGRRLFYDGNPTILLNLTHYTLDGGVVLLHYTKR